MSDEEWAFFAPFVIESGPKRGRPPKDHRLVLDGVFWIARTGSPWRDLPETFGPWASVYRQFRRWTLAGIWDLILEALNEAEGSLHSVQMIDSTVARAHHCAAGERGGFRIRVLGAQEVASRPRSISRRTARGCPSPSRSPAASEITGGEVSDYRGYGPLMEADGPLARVLLADRGYDSDAIRQDMQDRGGVAVIPARRNRKVRESVDTHIYALRNRIERCFNRLKNARRVATRYDKTAASFLGFVQITSIRMWFRDFVNTA